MAKYSPATVPAVKNATGETKSEITPVMIMIAAHILSTIGCTSTIIALNSLSDRSGDKSID